MNIYIYFVLFWLVFCFLLDFFLYTKRKCLICEVFVVV